MFDGFIAICKHIMCTDREVAIFRNEPRALYIPGEDKISQGQLGDKF